MPRVLRPRTALAIALVVGCGSGAANEADEGGEASLTERPTMTALHLDDDASVVIDGVVDPAWADAPAVTFDTAWSGVQTPIATRVRALWSERALYMLWELESAGLDVDVSRPVTEERPNLFEEDCVEIFLTPNPDERRRYFEIELGPRGHFFDLSIDRRSGFRSDPAWSSAAEIRTIVDPAAARATIEVAIRSKDITAVLARGAVLPMNLFRMEGRTPRQFLTWSPTRTPRPNFHVTDAFGTLRLD
jgi:hypothetical protein